MSEMGPQTLIEGVEYPRATRKVVKITVAFEGPLFADRRNAGPALSQRHRPISLTTKNERGLAPELDVEIGKRNGPGPTGRNFF